MNQVRQLCKKSSPYFSYKYTHDHLHLILTTLIDKKKIIIIIIKKSDHHFKIRLNTPRT